MDEKYQKFTGVVVGSHYNRELKAIRFILKFENNKEKGFEWPITMFSFPEGCDPDEEMEKTAKIMRGKKISVKDIQD